MKDSIGTFGAFARGYEGLDSPALLGIALKEHFGMSDASPLRDDRDPKLLRRTERLIRDALGGALSLQLINEGSDMATVVSGAAQAEIEKIQTTLSKEIIPLLVWCLLHSFTIKEVGIRIGTCGRQQNH